MSADLLRRAVVAACLCLGASISVGSANSLSVTSQSLTPYRTCTLTATPSTTTVVADTTARQSAAGSTSGTLTTLTVSSAANANQRIYVQFDLTQCSPAIPASATVRLATLRLYASALPGACRTIDLYPATAAWTESLLTWNNQPFGTAINNPASGSRTGTFNIGTPAGCQNLTTNAYIVGGTVTSDVASFVSGGATNLGWMLRDDVEGSATTRTSTFSSKNVAVVAQAPQLVITYVTVP